MLVHTIGFYLGQIFNRKNYIIGLNEARSHVSKNETIANYIAVYKKEHQYKRLRYVAVDAWFWRWTNCLDYYFNQKSHGIQ